MDWLRRLGQNQLLDVAAVVVAVICVAGTMRMAPLQARENDFAYYYLTGRLLLEGRRPLFL